MSQQRLIWDLPTRIFHWSLVISLVAAWVTAEWGFEEIHRQVGYFILGLVMFRLLWGIFGTKHARFSSFIPGTGRCGTPHWHCLVVHRNPITPGTIPWVA